MPPSTENPAGTPNPDVLNQMPVIDPSGTPGVIPHEDWPKAQAANYRQAYFATSPEGKFGILHPDDVNKAIGQGWQMGQPVKQPERGSDEWYASKLPEPVVSGLSWFQKHVNDPLNAAGKAAGEAGSELAKTFVDPAWVKREDNPYATHQTIRGIAGGIGEAAGSAVGDLRNWPFFLSGAGEARPLLQKLISGGFAAQQGAGAIEGAKYLHDNWDKMQPEERAQYATSAGLQGVFAGLSAAHVASGAGEPVRQGLATASDAVARTGQAVAESRPVQMAKDAVQGAKAAWNPEQYMTAEQAATKAFRPRNSKSKWNQEVASALPDMKRAAEQRGVDTENVTLPDALEAAQAAKKDVWAEYQQNHLDPASQVEVPTKDVADAIRSKITDRMTEQNPSLADRIDQVAATYENRTLTAAQLQERVSQLNNELRSIEAKYITDKRAAKLDPENAYRFAERDTLRGLLDDTLESTGGDGGADLRKRWGALNSVEDAISRRIPVADRRNPVSLTRIFEMLQGPGRIVRGIFGGGPADVAMGVFNTKAMMNAEKMNDPDWLAQRAFAKTTARPPAETRTVYNPEYVGPATRGMIGAGVPFLNKTRGLLTQGGGFELPAASRIYGRPEEPIIDRAEQNREYGDTVTPLGPLGRSGVMVRPHILGPGPEQPAVSSDQAMMPVGRASQLSAPTAAQRPLEGEVLPASAKLPVPRLDQLKEEIRNNFPGNSEAQIEQAARGQLAFEQSQRRGSAVKPSPEQAPFQSASPLKPAKAKAPESPAAGMPWTYEAAEAAVKAGKDVPPEVLKGYPDLEKFMPPAKRAETAALDQAPSGAALAPGKVGQMKISDLTLAPHKFQYKLGTDAEGVSTLLKDVKRFDPDLAGLVSVWKDPADGKTYIVNGHHRYELAKRTGTPEITVRHIVASDATAARAIGALQNIADGRGSAVDAAKFFRDSGLSPDDLKAKGISMAEGKVADGLALSHLDPSIFNRVVSGDLRQGRAIAIGEATPDAAEQKAILGLVERKERSGAKVSDDTLSELIRLVKGSEQRTESTADLFGTQEINRSLALEKAEVSAYIKQQLSKDKKLFGFVAKENRATELARAGNKINVEESGRISTEAAQAEEVYNKLSERGGPISSILDQSARRLADGENGATVKSDAYQKIRAEVSQTLGQAEGRSAQRSEGAPKAEEADKQKGPVDLFSPEAHPTPTFYSKAARVAFEKLPQSMSGESALATLKNAGVKAEEMKWLGLDDFLKDKPKVSKADVLSHILKNLVQIREVSKGQRTPEQQTAIDLAKVDRDNAEGKLRELVFNEFTKSGMEQGDSWNAAKLVADEIITGRRSSLEVLTDSLNPAALEERKLRAEYDGFVEEWRDRIGHPHANPFDEARGEDRKKLLDLSDAIDKAHRKIDAARRSASFLSAELQEAGRDLFNTSGDLRRARRDNQTPTKYESYTLPGEKTNYTELLLTLPRPERKVMDTIAKEMGYGGWTNQLTEAQKAEVERAFDAQPSQNPFSSAHFDEPNILAHVRFDDRVDAEGKKVLFIEEVQSDWHQKGKKVGYRSDEDVEAARQATIAAQEKMESQGIRMNQAGLFVSKGQVVFPYKIREATNNPPERRWLMTEGDSNLVVTAAPTKEAVEDIFKHNNGGHGRLATPEEADAIREYTRASGQQSKTDSAQRSAVPQAPFKSDWHELAMKRMLRAAAENGYDKLGWVTGEQTAERYDLSKRIDSVHYDPSLQMLTAIRDDAVVLSKRAKPEDIADYIGKEPAQKLLNATPEDGIQKLKNADLRIGATWATNLYDRAIPNFLNKYGKKWGVKVGDGKVSSSTEASREPYLTHENDGYWVEGRSLREGPFATDSEAMQRMHEVKSAASMVKVHAIDVTPEMKKSVLEDGQPLFKPATGPFLPSVAKQIDFQVVHTKPGMPSYLRLNGPATEAISRAMGVRFLGANIDKAQAKQVADALHSAAGQADKMGQAKAAEKLHSLAFALVDHAAPERGLHLVRQSDRASEELGTLHEEMLHGVQRQAGQGDFMAGVPWRQTLADPGMSKMAGERIVPQLVSIGVEPHPAVVVAEGLVDIMRGDAASELSPIEALKTAEKYFEAALQQHGIEHLQDFQDIEDFIAQREEALNVHYGREQSLIRSAGEKALATVLSRATRTGLRAGGETLSSKPVEGQGAESARPGETGIGAPDNAGPGRKGPASAPKETAFSTAPVGLSDDELTEWSKSKGFRYEPAGEQLGIFGQNDPLLRVFRQGVRGREQRALIYQSQLDNLKAGKLGPEEPFALTGAESKEEQPRLFGAGDLGEIIGKPNAEPGIKLPAKQKPENQSLFSPAQQKQRRSRIVGKLNPLASYLRPSGNGGTAA